MVSSIHPANVANARYTIKRWVVEAVADYDWPSYLDAVRVIMDMPETEANLPAISISHLQFITSDNYQGRNAENGVMAVKATDTAEIGLWASRSALWNGAECWMLQLEHMQSFMMSLYTANPTLQLWDVSTDYNNPVSVPYKLNFRSLNAVQAAADPNPDVMRIRLLLTYNFNMRSASG